MYLNGGTTGTNYTAINALLTQHGVLDAFRGLTSLTRPLCYKHMHTERQKQENIWHRTCGSLRAVITTQRALQA